MVINISLYDVIVDFSTKSTDYNDVTWQHQYASRLGIGQCCSLESVFKLEPKTDQYDHIMYLCVYVCVYMCVCMCVCMCVRMHVCMYVTFEKEKLVETGFN